MIRGVHVLAIGALVLGGLSMRATEFYATRYQSLPVQDWLESRAPFVESADVPIAADLARGISRALPLLTIRSEHSILALFGPPGFVQRTMGGVRDAARIDLGSPGRSGAGAGSVASGADAGSVSARLDVFVFNRALRARAWAELMGYEMDTRDPESGAAQVRTSGPDEADGVWLIAPSQGGGVANVVGHRGAVGFVIRVIVTRPGAADPAQSADLSARAEALARQAATDWTTWLATAS